jgi:hypothetical protein
MDSNLVFTNVGVFCQRNEQPELLFFRVQETQEEYDQGEHLNAAIDEAYDRGYNDCYAFHEEEPAGKAIKLKERTEDVELIEC